MQAPHCDRPQPNLVPVSPMASRMTQSRGMSDGTSTLWRLPFTVREIMVMPPSARRRTLEPCKEGRGKCAPGPQSNRTTDTRCVRSSCASCLRGQLGYDIQRMSVKDLFDLTGKVALVTGGSRGLGLDMATGLGEAGAAVVITARREQWLTTAEAELRAKGINCAGRRVRRVGSRSGGRRGQGDDRSLRPHRRARQQRRHQLGRAHRDDARREVAAGIRDQRDGMLSDVAGRRPRDAARAAAADRSSTSRRSPASSVSRPTCSTPSATPPAKARSSRSRATSP